MELSTQSTDGEKTVIPGKSLYADGYVRGIVDENADLKQKRNEDAETIRKLREDIEKMQERLTAPVAAAGQNEALKTSVEVFMQEIVASDLEKLLNSGWEKWHAEFKGSKLYVVMVRTRAADPQPQPQPAVADEAPAEPAKTVHVPDAIIDPDEQPEPSEPLEKILTYARQSAAELYKAESNARIYAAARGAYEYHMAQSKERPDARFFPSSPLLQGGAHV